jgi:hypothetical protein
VRDAGLPETEQTKSMVSSLWVVADCMGGYAGSTLGKSRKACYKCRPLFVIIICPSVADPDPNPNPHVLGLLDPDPLVRSTDPDPDHQAKLVRKTLIPTAL